MLWDAEFGVLWALGTQEIVAFEISGTTENPVITRIAEFGCRVTKGHDLSLIPNGNGFYWYAGNAVDVFSKYDNAILAEDIGQSKISALSVKSVGKLPERAFYKARPFLLY